MTDIGPGTKKHFNSNARPGHSYRAARRNRARDLGYVWTELPRRRRMEGVFVDVPLDDPPKEMVG